MAFFFAPAGNSQFFDANGNPLVGGKIATYLAGSTTNTATYTSSTGATQQANPIILNSLGLPASPIWLAEGINYKLVISSATDVVLATIDNIEGINDAATSASEWVSSGFVPTFLTTTTFSVPGDQTDTLSVGRRLRTTNTAGLIYSTITASVFGAVTTVTVKNDSGVLDAGLSVVSYGLLAPTNVSVPATVTGSGPAFSAYQSTLQSISTSTLTKVQFQTEEFDTAAAFDSTTNYRFTPLVAGYYQINGAAALASLAGSLTAIIYKNGTEFKRGTNFADPGLQATASALISMNGTTDYVELFMFQASGGSINTVATASQTYFQGFLARPA